MRKIAEIFGRIIGDELVGERVADYIEENPHVTAQDLTKFRGIGLATATTLMMVMENSAEYLAGTRAKSVTRPEDMLPRLAHLRFEKQEHFVLLTLDSANHIINVHELTIGLANQTPVHPREAFRNAILDNAASVVFAHNHPSGSNEPSREDIGITRVLIAAGKIVQIPVIDHLIISRSGFTSMCRQDPDMFEIK